MPQTGASVQGQHLFAYRNSLPDLLNPIALRMAKTPWSFDRSECNRVKDKSSVWSNFVL